MNDEPQNPDQNPSELDAGPDPVPAATPPATWPATDSASSEAALPPAYAPAAVAVPTSSNAIIAFVLSIVSWALCPIVPAIVALVLAQSAEREIAAGQGGVQGAGLVTAAKIISWINIGLWAAFLVIGGFIGLLLVVAGS